jgi:hypothetical protein
MHLIKNAKSLEGNKQAKALFNLPSKTQVKAEQEAQNPV